MISDMTLPWFSAEHLHQLIATYGYAAVGVVVALESMGLPLPGEAILIIGAVYASTQHDLSIWGVIASAAAGGIVGDNIGYWVGRTFGYSLLLRYGQYIGLSDAKIKLGQYLFLRHGAKVVFFGRFIAVLRILAAFLAGVNRMGWRAFLAANVAGCISWASLYGLGAYSFGAALVHTRAPLGIGLSIFAVVTVFLAALYVRSHESELQKEAETALPGPLQRVRWPGRSATRS
jgi:membrane protein DedA with SNARE-associated domain